MSSTDLRADALGVLNGLETEGTHTWDRLLNLCVNQQDTKKNLIIYETFEIFYCSPHQCLTATS